MGSSSAPHLRCVLSIVEPGAGGQRFEVHVLGKNLQYGLGDLTDQSPRTAIETQLAKFKQGSTVTLYDDQEASISWTAETFGKNDANLGLCSTICG
jgi:hypothetical protein